MYSLLHQILVLLLLIIVSSVFVLSETAILSARKAVLQKWAGDGNERARAALSLSASPNQFLSTVQIGVTLVGVLLGAYGEATLSDRIAEHLREMPAFARHATPLSLGIVVLSVTYVNLILGELVPKRLALHSPERVASAVALPVRVLSIVTAPVVRLLSVSTDLVLKLFGVHAPRETPVTEDEIRVLIDQGTQAGVFEEAEQDMVERVFRLGDRRVSGLMTPRTDIVWLDLEEPADDVRRQLGEVRYSRLPVAQGSLDDVLGIVNVGDLLAQTLSGSPLDLKAAVRPALFVPDTMRALALMEHFKQSGSHLALVTNEFGGVQGLVTFSDVLQAIVGEMSPLHEDTPQAVQREDGSWLVDGLLSVDEFKDLFELDQLPEEGRGDYQTVGGFVVMQVGHIPAPADHFEWGGLRLEVLDMDGNRVDKVLVTRLPPEGPAESPPDAP